MSRSNSNQVGRSNFRSQGGCCICGTKSSSSRFTHSQRYSEHFLMCFGQEAENREGDLCNACVLCVKRWLQRGKTKDFFAKVLDSKKGPGPKHMKEITKRARRREDRAKAAMLAKDKPSSSNATIKSKTSDISKDSAFEDFSSGIHSSMPNSPKMEQTDDSGKGSFGTNQTLHTSYGNDNDSSDFSNSRNTRSTAYQQSHNSNHVQFHRSSVVTRSSNVNSFSNSTESSSNTPNSDSSTMHSHSNSRKKGSPPNHSLSNPYRREIPTRRSLRHLHNYMTRSVNNKRNAMDSYDSISWVHHSSLISGYNELFVNCCCNRQPNGYFSSSPNWDRSNAFTDEHANHQGYTSSSRLLRSTVNGISNRDSYNQCELSSQSSVCSNASSLMLRTRASRYNRRVILPPVRMCVNEETDQLLRQIMEKNSEALDAREVHMAVQRRLRNRSSLNCGGTTSTCSSSQCGNLSSSANNTSASSFHELQISNQNKNEQTPSHSNSNHGWQSLTPPPANNSSSSNHTNAGAISKGRSNNSSLSSDFLSLANIDSASSSTFGDAWSPAPPPCSNNKRNSTPVKNNSACGNCWCCHGPHTTNSCSNSLPLTNEIKNQKSSDLYVKTTAETSSNLSFDLKTTKSDQMSISMESSLSSGFVDDSSLLSPPAPLVTPLKIN